MDLYAPCPDGQSAAWSSLQSQYWSGLTGTRNWSLRKLSEIVSMSTKNVYERKLATGYRSNCAANILLRREIEIELSCNALDSWAWLFGLSKTTTSSQQVTGEYILPCGDDFSIPAGYVVFPQVAGSISDVTVYKVTPNVATTAVSSADYRVVDGAALEFTNSVQLIDGQYLTWDYTSSGATSVSENAQRATAITRLVADGFDASRQLTNGRYERVRYQTFDVKLYAPDANQIVGKEFGTTKITGEMYPNPSDSSQYDLLYRINSI